MSMLYDRIYEAVFFPELWKDILHDLSVGVNAEGAVLANLSNSKGGWIGSEGVMDLYRDFFEEGWGYGNAKTKALLSIPHQGFLSDADHLSEAWMAEQPIYRDFYWKRGFGYAAGTVIEAPSGDVIAISVEKKKVLGPVDRQGLDFLDGLRPHLARATLLASRFEFAKIEAALQALQATNLPAAVIGSTGRTLACNPLFEALSSQIVIESRDRIRFQNKAANTFFETVLARRASGRDGEAGDGGHSFPIPADGSSLPAVIHLLPILGAGRDIFLRAAYILVATPLDRSATPSEAVIKGLFDLTPAEARIGHRLAAGATVRSVAGEHRVSIETVRSHVKSILAKSGINRQSDFVAMVSSLRTVVPDKGAPDRGGPDPSSL